MCPVCGDALHGPRRYCATCDTFLISVQANPPTIQPEMEIEIEQNTRTDVRENEEGYFWEVFLLVFLVVIIVVAILFFTGSCNTCGGDGQIESSAYSGDYYVHVTLDCPDCGGTGESSSGSYGFWIAVALLVLMVLIAVVKIAISD